MSFLKQEKFLLNYYSSSEKDTFLFGKNFAKMLNQRDIVAFFGNLGVGKTVFIKGITSYFNYTNVTSPTFTYLNIYEAEQTIYHFDLYRIKNKIEFCNMGFLDYFQNGLCLIEWSEKIKSIIPPKAYIVDMHYQDLDNREIIITQNEKIS